MQSASEPGPATSEPGSNQPEAHQVERVETLIATVRDIVSSLGRLSIQLEHEVGQALRHTSSIDQGIRIDHAIPARPVGLAAVEQENAQLRQAIEGRAGIEQAKGMLMAAHGCDADRAFTILTEISRREQRKVREVAADLVAAGTREAARRAPRPADARPA